MFMTNTEHCISPSLAVAGKPGKRHANMPAHKPQAVSDWLNPPSQPLIALQI